MAPSWRTSGPRMATAYHMGATRQRTTRPSRERSPARPSSWAVTTTAATRGPKTPRKVAGTGSAGIEPRASSAAGTHNVHVKAKANAKYLSGNALVVAVGRDGLAAVVAILSPPYLCGHGDRRARRRGDPGVGLLRAGLGPDAHRPGGGSAQDAVGHPRPAYSQQHRARGHRR